MLTVLSACVLCPNPEPRGRPGEGRGADPVAPRKACGVREGAGLPEEEDGPQSRCRLPGLAPQTRSPSRTETSVSITAKVVMGPWVGPEACGPLTCPPPRRAGLNQREKNLVLIFPRRAASRAREKTTEGGARPRATPSWVLCPRERQRRPPPNVHLAGPRASDPADATSDHPAAVTVPREGASGTRPQRHRGHEAPAGVLTNPQATVGGG